jgi:hypothetical protein
MVNCQSLYISWFGATNYAYHLGAASLQSYPASLLYNWLFWNCSWIWY